MTKKPNILDRQGSSTFSWLPDTDIELFLRKLPKVELHVHFDGSFDPALLRSYLESSKESYASLPLHDTCPWDNSVFPVRASIEQCRNLLEFHSLCTCRGKRSLHEMIKCFMIFMPIIRGKVDLLEKLAYDFVKRQAEQNIIYTEVRYSPHLLAKGGNYSGTDHVDPEPVLNAITKGLRRGEQDFGVRVNQILCCITWRPDWADDVIRIAHERRNDSPCAVVGVDVAAGEEFFDKDKYPHLHFPHLRALEEARKLNLNITLHAGEVDDSENIKTAISWGAQRIGHGYRIVSDPNLIQEMKEKKIHFEVCPTSSVETGGWDYKKGEKDWSKHPIITMIQNGMNVGFNSDDPAVFNTSLTWQLRIAKGKMGIDRNTIISTIYNSISSAFLSEQDKCTLREKVDEYLECEDIFASECSSMHDHPYFVERVLNN